MAELRERMTHDLVVRGLSSRTQESYVAAVKGLAKYYGQRPDEFSEQQVQGYVRHLMEGRQLAPNSVRLAVFGMRFFYEVTLRRQSFALPLPKGVKKLPEVLSQEEVARLVASAATLRERALLMTTYGGGLRVSEVVRLRVRDIDAERGVIRVEQGKGRKDRYTLLGSRLLAELRHYWQVYRPALPWLFPQRTQPAPLDPATAQKVYYGAKGRAGITAVLHTWGQTLTEHIHLHCVVTGGGLSADGTQWRPSSRRFLFAVKALSKVFRGQYLSGLTRLRAHHQLCFAGASAPLADDRAWRALLSQLHHTPWVVYSKPPFGGPQQVMKYLSRYTHRVAIANERLAFIGNGRVRFRYQDYSNRATIKIMELGAEEFLRHFLLHVVPPHFVRIRHFGLLANRCRQDKLARCRQLLAPALSAAAPTPSTATQGTDTSLACNEPPTCPVCGVGRLRVIEILLPHRGIPP